MLTCNYAEHPHFASSMQGKQRKVGAGRLGKVGWPPAIPYLQVAQYLNRMLSLMPQACLTPMPRGS